MEIFDYNCFVGNWPFHRLRNKSLEDLIFIHEKNGVKGGVVSSLDAIFYNDPFEADFILSKELIGTNYSQYLTVNPMLIGSLDNLQQNIETIKPVGIRIYPGYHGYSLKEEKLYQLCDFLKKINLPLVITQRMEDERITYLMHPKNPTSAEWSDFLSNNKELKILITNMKTYEVLQIKDRVLSMESVFFDTSGINSWPNPIEYIIGEGFGKKTIFGSCSPLNCFSSSFFIIHNENISCEDKILILSGEGFQ